MTRLLAASLLVLALTGCGRLAGVLGGSTAAGVVDAHAVYDLRPGCATLLARTLDNGYTLLAPLADTVTPEATGLFEGPVREGESVFRYTSPAGSETWADPTDVPVDVLAVRLELPEARARFDQACGVPAGAARPADPDVPRLPGRR